MRLRPVLLGALTAALPALALAQQEPVATGAPLGSPPAAPVEQTQTPAPRGSLPVEVETQELRALDAWTVGTMTGEQGALPRNAWAQTDPATLVALYDALPSVYESPAAQVIARRALLSGADAPPGDATAAARKRFEALGRMGAADELSQMAAGATLNDAAIAQYAAQAELARGRRPEACARGRAATGETPAHFILRLRAFCSAVGGDRAAADLALELARGNGGEDAWFTSAIGIVGGAPPTRAPAARYDNTLAAAVSLAANLRPGANPLNNASTLALTTLARSEDTPAAIRANAAQSAFRRGAISAADARRILAATPAANTTGLPSYVAPLRLIAADARSPAAGAAVVGVLQRATAPADFAAAARFFHDDITALTRGAEAQNAAPAANAQTPAPAAVAPPAAPAVFTLNAASAMLFARAAIVTGDVRLAERMVEASRAAGANVNAMAPIEAAYALMRNVRGADLTLALQRRIDVAGTNAAARQAAARDIMLMNAAGFTIDETMLAFVTANAPAGGTALDPAKAAALQSAVQRRAVGEVALIAAGAVGGGVSRLDADGAAGVIRALRNARLEGDARRLAVEAVLAGAPAAGRN